MSVVATAASIIARYGKTMTLIRPGETDLSLKGKRLAGSITEAGGTSRQQEFQVLISTTELLASDWANKAPSADTDQIMVDGKLCALLDAQPRSEGNIVAMYDLTVAG